MLLLAQHYRQRTWGRVLAQALWLALVARLAAECCLLLTQAARLQLNLFGRAVESAFSSARLNDSQKTPLLFVPLLLLLLNWFQV